MEGGLVNTRLAPWRCSLEPEKGAGLRCELPVYGMATCDELPVGGAGGVARPFIACGGLWWLV
jgi:hypothetical protein